jgi:hypothetical protein
MWRGGQRAGRQGGAGSAAELRELVERLAEAESSIRFGKLVANYADWRVMGCKVYLRQGTRSDCRPASRMEAGECSR